MYTDVVQEVLDCGQQDAQYRHLMATVSHRLLADLDLSLSTKPALVMPAMKSPFPRLLVRRTTRRPVFVVDLAEEDLRWQRENTGHGCECLVSRNGKVPYALRNVGLVLNPFGLQHYRHTHRRWDRAGHSAGRAVQGRGRMRNGQAMPAKRHGCCGPGVSSCSAALVPPTPGSLSR